MEWPLSIARRSASIDIPSLAGFIRSLQRPSGEIPWSREGKTDPWDHIESAMGLTVAGDYEGARQAFQWLRDTQLSDGSWWAATRNGVPEDTTRDSNHAAYLAVGLYHHYLVTGDPECLRAFWEPMEAGIDYAVGLQAPTGEIHWAKNGAGITDRMALLTGSSCVYLSLGCALAAAGLLRKRRRRWEEAREKLGRAIRLLPSAFNMMKARYAMDWYYPVLSGAVEGREARLRIDRSWDKFVVPGWGVRCVNDQPWVTTAEGCELVLALTALGDRERAAVVFDWLLDKKYGDGSYWMGVTFPDGVIWPEERTSWTTAAMILASDALQGWTRGACIFRHDFWAGCGQAP